MCFLSNFGCKIIFLCSVNFWHQQDSNSLLKGSIDHVTSWCKWRITNGPLDSGGKKRENNLFSSMFISRQFDTFLMRCLRIQNTLLFFWKRFSFNCSLLDALETFGTNHSYYYPIAAAGVIWSKSWNWNLYMNRWWLLNCVYLIDRARRIKSVSNIF